jgi:uncharacterized membrane protein
MKMRSQLQAAGIVQPRQRLLLEHVIWTFFFAMTLLALILPPLRYVAYLAPLFAVILALANRRFMNDHIVAPFLFLVLMGIVFSPMATTEGLKDLWFIVAGVSLSAAIITLRIDEKWLYGIFILGSIVFAFAFNGLGSGLRYNFMNSESSFEGNFSFLFGILAVYSAIRGRHRMALVCFLTSIFVLKRIVVVAELACFAALYLQGKTALRVLDRRLMVAFNLGFIAILVLYGSGAFNFVIEAYTGQSADQFGMGRQAIYAQVSADALEDPFRHFFIGGGPGSAYELIGAKAMSVGLKNLHSDLLKIAYEYGLLVFGIFVWIGYSAKRMGDKVLFLFANIVFITDNALIYQFFLFFLCAASRSLEGLDQRQIDTSAAAQIGATPNA